MLFVISIHKLNEKQCRSWSDGFFRSHLIWIFTFFKGNAYPGSAGQGFNVHTIFKSAIIHLRDPRTGLSSLLTVHFLLGNLQTGLFSPFFCESLTVNSPHWLDYFPFDSAFSHFYVHRRIIFPIFMWILDSEFSPLTRLFSLWQCILPFLCPQTLYFPHFSVNPWQWILPTD